MATSLTEPTPAGCGHRETGQVREGRSGPELPPIPRADEVEASGEVLWSV
jgi:hypothetical protein